MIDPSTAITVLGSLNTAFGTFEKVTKAYREWGKTLPETPAKKEAIKDLEHVEEALQIAKIELAKGFGYRLCKRHFPPGILLDIRENESPKWMCESCKDISPKEMPPMDYGDNSLIDVR